jgi:hypothetical protein
MQDAGEPVCPRRFRRPDLGAGVLGCAAGAGLTALLLEVLAGPARFPRGRFPGRTAWACRCALESFRARQTSSRLLDFKQAIDPHRQDGDAQIVGEQADSGAERAEFAVFGVLPFRKDEHAVAAIDGLSGVGKALAEAGLARQREQVQQGDAERPLHAVVDSTQPRPIEWLSGGQRSISSASPPVAVASLWRMRAGSANWMKPTSTSAMWFETTSSGPRTPRRFSRPVARGHPRRNTAGRASR